MAATNHGSLTTGEEVFRRARGRGAAVHPCLTVSIRQNDQPMLNTLKWTALRLLQAVLAAIFL